MKKKIETNKTKKAVGVQQRVIQQTDLLQKLEEIKQAGNYAVCLYYGEDIGCDDLDVKPEERRALVVCHPVGCLGSVRTIYNGSIKTLLKFDPKEKPIQLNNPPKSEDYRKEGFYAFGSDDMIKSYYERFAV